MEALIDESDSFQGFEKLFFPCSWVGPLGDRNYWQGARPLIRAVGLM